MSKVKIGLMGLGEIGRDIYRLTLSEPDLDVVAISDIGKAEILHYLLETDGRKPVGTTLEGNFLVQGDNRARFIHGVSPADVPWDTFDVDVVIDSTHKYRTRETLSGHLEAGAKRVILSTIPYEEVDNMVVMGVNEAAGKAGFPMRFPLALDFPLRKFPHPRRASKGKPCLDRRAAPGPLGQTARSTVGQVQVPSKLETRVLTGQGNGPLGGRLPHHQAGTVQCP